MVVVFVRTKKKPLLVVSSFGGGAVWTAGEFLFGRCTVEVYRPLLRNSASFGTEYG